MITVEMGEVSSSQAFRASLASLLEMSLEYMPSFDGLSAKMEWDAWLASRLNLYCYTFTDFSAPPAGYWLLHLKSQYVSYEFHTVVMHAGNLLHDPHPEPQELDYQRAVSGMIFIPLDPSAVSGRFAWNAGDGQ